MESAALALQAEGLSVNRLLFACWLASIGRELQPADLGGEAQDWQQSLTHPLRALRYQVRTRKQQRPELEACYAKLRAAELAAEQVELWLLWQGLSEVHPVPAATGAELARINLQRVCSCAGRADAAALQPALEVLVRAAFPVSVPTDAADGVAGR